MSAAAVIASWLCAGVALIGCDRVFGLDRGPGEAGTDCPNDRDCDGVLDSVDNCIEIPNTDQRDLDRDGIGDACDPCAAHAPSATIDSDLDGVNDNVDRCPGIPDTQADGDGDGLGDACDPDPTSHDRVRCFYDFEDQALAVTAWGLDQNIWVNGVSIISHFGADPPGAITLELTGLLPEVTRFALQTSGYPQDQLLRPSEYGVAVGGTALAPGTRCVLTSTTQFADTVAILGPDDAVLASTGVTFDPSMPTYVQLVANRTKTSTQITCSIHRGIAAPAVVSATAPALTGTPSVSLVARNIGGSFADLTIVELGVP